MYLRKKKHLIKFSNGPSENKQLTPLLMVSSIKSLCWLYSVFFSPKFLNKYDLNLEANLLCRISYAQTQSNICSYKLQDKMAFMQKPLLPQFFFPLTSYCVYLSNLPPSNSSSFSHISVPCHVFQVHLYLMCAYNKQNRTKNSTRELCVFGFHSNLCSAPKSP